MTSWYRFPLFSELTKENSNIEMQVHTDWTDGKNSVEEMIFAASGKGLETFAFTEHARASSVYFPKFKEKVRTLSSDFPNMRVLCGVEVKILNFSGDLDLAPEIESSAEIKLASVHSFPVAKNKRVMAGSFKFEDAANIERDLAVSAIKTGRADVLAHPGGMCCRFFSKFPLQHFKTIMIACKDYDVAFELNYAYHREVIGDIIELLRAVDPPVSIGSDAHEVSSVGKARDMVREFILNG